jgi:hypothetical protein
MHVPQVSCTFPIDIMHVQTGVLPVQTGGMHLHRVNRKRKIGGRRMFLAGMRSPIGNKQMFLPVRPIRMRWRRDVDCSGMFQGNVIRYIVVSMM